MHFRVRPDICYKFESSVKNGKNNVNDEKALLRSIFIKFLGYALWRPFDLCPKFTAKWKAYIIQERFMKTAFIVLILETAKS